MVYDKDSLFFSSWNLSNRDLNSSKIFLLHRKIYYLSNDRNKIIAVFENIPARQYVYKLVVCKLAVYES